MPLRCALLLSALVAGCRYTEIRDQCPTCTVTSRHAPAPPLPAGTRTLFVVVPGLLGFGWEWDEPLARLRAVPDAAIVTFSWRPSSSVSRVADDLAEVVDDVLHRAGAPAQLVIIGHSAAGLVTSLMGARIHVPEGSAVHIVNIGTPYAGMHTTPFEYPRDGWRNPVAFAIGGVLETYPRLASRVTLESWITPWPGDPVMRPRFGHRPDDPAVGPPGPRFRAPPGADHNRFIARVADDLARRVVAGDPRTPAPEPARDPGPAASAPVPPPR